MPEQTISSPPPPIGSPEQADKYLQKITELINNNKLPVHHTDLQKFDIASIQDHYKMDLQDYEVEVSHSKKTDTGRDFYILLFNNVKKIQNNEGSCQEKVILAYIHLTAQQFENFKAAADGWLERKRIEEEAIRFKEVMDPIDKVLGDLETVSTKEPNELASLQGQSHAKGGQSGPEVPEEPKEDWGPPASVPLSPAPAPSSDYLTDTYPPYPQNPNP